MKKNLWITNKIDDVHRNVLEKSSKHEKCTGNEINEQRRAR